MTNLQNHSKLLDGLRQSPVTEPPKIFMSANSTMKETPTIDVCEQIGERAFSKSSSYVDGMSPDADQNETRTE